MAELYWVHLPEHSDILSEGYIGITKHTAEHRYRGHIKAANHRTRPTNAPVYNAIRKYGDKLIIKTLVVGDYDYVAFLEERLRPVDKIGWNIKSGGKKGKVIGTKHSKESKEKMSVIQKEVHSRPEVIEKRALVILNRRPLDFSYLDEKGKPFKFWATRYTKGRFPELWKNIPKIFELYTKNNLILATQSIRQLDEYESKNRAFVSRILNYFRSGWNPLSDELYLEDFPFEK